MQAQKRYGESLTTQGPHWKLSGRNVSCLIDLCQNVKLFIASVLLYKVI